MVNLLIKTQYNTSDGSLYYAEFNLKKLKLEKDKNMIKYAVFIIPCKEIQTIPVLKTFGKRAIRNKQINLEYTK